MNDELCLDEKLAIMYGLTKVDSIHSCCPETYAWFKPPYAVKSHLVYRDVDDIYNNDYATWNPSQDLDLIMMIVEKFQNTKDFYLEALNNNEQNFHNQSEFAFILSKFLVDKFWKSFSDGLH